MDSGDIRTRSVAGAAAGNLTVTGIKVGDKLIAVQPVGVAAANLVNEFTVTADDTINNTGGTSSAAQFVLVIWEALGGGRALGEFTSSTSANQGQHPGRTNY